MQGRSATVISDADIETDLLQEKVKNVRKGTATGHVEERFTETVAAIHRLALPVQFLEVGEVVLPACRDHLYIVGTNLLFRYFGEVLIQGERWLDLQPVSVHCLEKLLQEFIGRNVILGMVRHRSIRFRRCRCRWLRFLIGMDNDGVDFILDLCGCF